MSVLSLFLRLGVSMVVVLLLVRVAAGLLQRTGAGGGPRRGRAEVEVLYRQPLGRRASLGVVRAGERALLLGITDHTVTLLGEADADELLPPIPESPRTAAHPGGPATRPPTWTAVVDALRDRTVRRR